jgi:hypothetical protein
VSCCVAGVGSFSTDLETECSTVRTKNAECKVLSGILHNTEEECISPGFFSLGIHMAPQEISVASMTVEYETTTARVMQMSVC